MTTKPDEPWPPYRIGSPDHLHALGAIAVAYNLLEFCMRGLFNLYSIRDGVFANSTNFERLKIIREAVDKSAHPDAIKIDVKYFLDAYETCTENRNILMHSTAMFTWLDPNADRCPVSNPKQPDGIAFQKPARKGPFKIEIYRPTLKELRGVADDMVSFEDYGDRLRFHILQIHEPARYADYRFPAEAKFELPKRPLLQSLCLRELLPKKKLCELKGPPCSRFRSQRWGSLADIAAGPRDVRFTPEIGHLQPHKPMSALCQ
jgi:hypothetical protein